jgi:N-hydroxyarylamine O-acetyltransferase
VLEKLGVPRPEPDLAGLASVYRAWCRGVPFDNVHKLIHLRAGSSAPLPGDDARDFFDDWLAGGAGGTCWAGNGALFSLLDAVGFEASRGIATMLAGPDLPPNHGTVRVTFGRERYLVDASILHGEPLPLDEDRETAVGHPAFGVRCVRRDGRFHVHWRPLHLPMGLDCRLERFDASAQEFRALHEQTRAWSPFNFQLSARLVKGDGVVGVGFGRRGDILPDGEMTNAPLEPEARTRLLVTKLGIAAGLAGRLPQDVATPPPPGSATALASRQAEPRAPHPGDRGTAGG